MSFQLARTHTLVVLAATTIAASAVVIPSLAEGRNSSQDALCASLIGAQGPIGSQYNPLLASYAAAAGRATTFAGDHAREAQLRAALSDAQAALESAKAGAQQSTPSAGGSSLRGFAADRGLDWVDWSTVDDATQARIIEALIVQKVNAYRANAGLPELVVSATVTADARAWSKHMSDSDDFNHDPIYKYLGAGKLDGGDTTYASENIAYNHRENFGDKWGADGTLKDPAQAANALFDQWKNSSGHDKNMLAQNNVVGVGVHIAKHGERTRIYGTQKFYAITAGVPNTQRFHTIGDAASAYGFDSDAFRADNTTYVSGLAGSGDDQRANSWQNKVGALPGRSLPVDVSELPTRPGAATAAPTAPASKESEKPVERTQAVADAQAAVDRAQADLDGYLASVPDERATESLADIDAELDRVADSIASATSVHPEKDGGVTVRNGGRAGRYLTAVEYQRELARCSTVSLGPAPSQSARSQDAGEGEANPLMRQSGQSLATPNTPAGGGVKRDEPPADAPVSPNDRGGEAAHTGITPPATSAHADASGIPASARVSTPSQARAQALAATGSSAVWVGIGALALLVVGAGALIASRRAKR